MACGEDTIVYYDMYILWVHVICEYLTQSDVAGRQQVVAKKIQIELY